MADTSQRPISATTAETIDYLRSLPAVRERSSKVYELAKSGELDHWDFDEGKLDDVVEFCGGLLSRDFGTDYDKVSTEARRLGSKGHITQIPKASAQITEQAVLSFTFISFPVPTHVVTAALNGGGTLDKLDIRGIGPGQSFDPCPLARSRSSQIPPTDVHNLITAMESFWAPLPASGSAQVYNANARSRPIADATTSSPPPPSPPLHTPSTASPLSALIHRSQASQTSSSAPQRSLICISYRCCLTLEPGRIGPTRRRQCPPVTVRAKWCGKEEGAKGWRWPVSICSRRGCFPVMRTGSYRWMVGGFLFFLFGDYLV